MDNSMQIDTGSALSRNRKRSVHQRDADSEDEEPVSNDQLDTPGKRLRNGRGDPIHRRVLRYNAQALLNNLAFTRLYVTANFHNYNPSVSPVILCIVSEHDVLYRALCEVLPVLYKVAPALQALAILTRASEEPVGPGHDLARVMPVTSLTGLQEKTVDDFQCFVEALSGDSDTVVMIDAGGTCLWTSDDLQSGEGYLDRDAECLKSELEQALLGALGHRPQEDLMDEG